MKNIYIVRHGESEGNIKDIKSSEYIIDSSISLTLNGMYQAASAGEKLNQLLKNSKATFWISPFKRTRQTLRGIVRELENVKYNVFEDPRLVEQDFGDFDFQFYDKWEEISPHSRYINKSRYNDPTGRFFARLENGENMLDVYNRMSLFVTTRLERTRYKNNIIVTHGNASKALVMYLLRKPVEYYYYTEVPKNASIRHIVYKNGVYIDKGYIE